jgi:hypothetical protein
MLREPLPDELPPSFRVANALGLGVGLHRLEASDLRAPHSGLRTSTDAPGTLEARCLELLPLMTDAHCFSHATAARLWGLPVPLREETETDLHVTSKGSAREPRRPGVIGHRSADVLITRHLGLPVATPLRVWAQCAETFTVEELVVMGDALVSKWSRFGPARYRALQQLERLVARWKGRRGAWRLKEALALVRLHSWSPKETEVRLFVRRCGRLEPPDLNQRMYAADGRYLGRPDLAYRQLKIGIEYEGDEHRRSKWRFRTDISRGEGFADDGWRIFRVTEHDLESELELATRFRRHLPPA